MASLLRQLNFAKPAMVTLSRMKIFHNDSKQAVTGTNSIQQCVRMFSALNMSENPEKRKILNDRPQAIISINQVRHYKAKDILHLRCKGCFFVRRHDRLFVECKLKGRHKQMQKIPKWRLYKDDYSKGNIVRAAFWNYHHERYYKLGDKRVEKFDWLAGKIGNTV